MNEFDFSDLKNFVNIKIFTTYMYIYNIYINYTLISCVICTNKKL